MSVKELWSSENESMDTPSQMMRLPSVCHHWLVVHHRLMNSSTPGGIHALGIVACCYLGLLGTNTLLNDCEKTPNSLNLCESVESRPTGKVRGSLTTPNLCESLESRPTGQVWVSLEWFVNTEPPRTTLVQGEAGYRAVSSEFFVHTTPPQTTVMKWKAGLQGRYESVKGGSTTPNLL